MVITPKELFRNLDCDPGTDVDNIFVEIDVWRHRFLYDYMVEFLMLCSDVDWVLKNTRPSLAVMTSTHPATKRNENVMKAYTGFYKTAKPAFRKKYGFWQGRKVLVGLNPKDL